MTTPAPMPNSRADLSPTHVVDISDLCVSAAPEHLLVTYSLGSCVGVTLFDPVARVGGMIHSMLPRSSIDRDKARASPAMFVDTGMATLLQMLFDHGARRDRLVAKVAGACCILDKKEMFRIGQRNHTMLRKLLWKNEILIAAEDVGGDAPRTLYLRMADGATLVRSRGTFTLL